MNRILVMQVAAAFAIAASGATQASPLIVQSGQLVELWGNQTYDSVSIESGGVLRVPDRYFDGGLFGSGEWEGGWLNLQTSGDFLIEEGGWLDANYSGYSHWDNSFSQDQWGPGAGQNMQWMPPGGGGYGGAGGYVAPSGGWGGDPYGSATAIDYGPDNSIQMGSAGGSVGTLIIDPGGNVWQIHAAGGAGGGGVLISAGGSATIDGTISANGESATNYAGGIESGAGSGGQIIIDCGYVRVGVNGSLQAMGGNTLNSGAGGGGRIKMGPAATLVLEGSVSSAFRIDGGTASQSNGDGYDGTVSVPTALQFFDSEASFLAATGVAQQRLDFETLGNGMATSMLPHQSLWSSVTGYLCSGTEWDNLGVSFSAEDPAKRLVLQLSTGVSETVSSPPHGLRVSTSDLSSGDDSSIVLTFAVPVRSVGFMLIDNERGSDEERIFLYDEFGAVVGAEPLPAYGSTSNGPEANYFRGFAYAAGIARIVIHEAVDLGDGMLIDDLRFTPIPEPATLGLLALGGAALLRRRRAA